MPQASYRIEYQPSRGLWLLSFGSCFLIQGRGISDSLNPTIPVPRNDESVKLPAGIGMSRFPRCKVNLLNYESYFMGPDPILDIDS